MIRQLKTHTLYLSAGGLMVLAFDQKTARVANRFDLPEGENTLNQDLLTSPDALAFRAWVESQPGAQFQLLIDHVDEQHALEKIPKLGFRDRAALIAKRFNQQFRDSEFRITSRIPRQAGDSRREERLVMMALKSSVNLSPWLDILLLAKARVSLMTSPSLLSWQLIKSIAPGQSGLLISRHPAGLRQTLVIDGTVRFSRLARLKAYDVPSVRAEILRSIQYLTMTQRLAASVVSGDKFSVWLVEDAIDDTHQLPASINLDSGSLVSIRRLGAEQLGMPLVSGAEGLSVWATLCQVRPGRLNYANTRVGFFQHLANWRQRLWTGAAVVAGAGLLMALLADEITSWHGHRMGEVQSEITQLQSRIAQLREKLSLFPTTPEDLRAAVRISERLVANEAEPTKLLDVVSRALVQTEGLSLNGISFSAHSAPGTTGEFAAVTGLGNASSETPNLLADRIKLTVSGLVDQQLSRTDANNQIRLLADALIAQCPCAIAQLDLPFDASAQSGLTASLNNQFRRNREFKIVLLRQQPANPQHAASGGDLVSTMSVSAMGADHE